METTTAFHTDYILSLWHTDFNNDMKKVKSKRVSIGGCNFDKMWFNRFNVVS